MRDIKGIPIWGISEKGLVVEYGLFILLLLFMILSGMKVIWNSLINRGRQIKKRSQILSLVQYDTTPPFLNQKNTKRKKTIDPNITMKKSEKIFSVLNNNSTSKGFHYLNPGIDLNDIIVLENDNNGIKLHLIEVKALRKRREKDIETAERKKKDNSIQIINIKDDASDRQKVVESEKEVELIIIDEKVATTIENEIIKENVSPTVEIKNIDTKIGENSVQYEGEGDVPVKKDKKNEIDATDQNQLKSKVNLTEDERQVKVGKHKEKRVTIQSEALSMRINTDVALDRILASSEGLNELTTGGGGLNTFEIQEVVDTSLYPGSHIGITIVSNEVTSFNITAGKTSDLEESALSPALSNAASASASASTSTESDYLIIKEKNKKEGERTEIWNDVEGEGEGKEDGEGEEKGIEDEEEGEEEKEVEEEEEEEMIEFDGILGSSGEEDNLQEEDSPQARTFFDPYVIDNDHNLEEDSEREEQILMERDSTNEELQYDYQSTDNALSTSFSSASITDIIDQERRDVGRDRMDHSNFIIKSKLENDNDNDNEDDISDDLAILQSEIDNKTAIDSSSSSFTDFMVIGTKIEIHSKSSILEDLSWATQGPHIKKDASSLFSTSNFTTSDTPSFPLPRLYSLDPVDDYYSNSSDLYEDEKNFLQNEHFISNTFMNDKNLLISENKKEDDDVLRWRNSKEYNNNNSKININMSNNNAKKNDASTLSSGRDKSNPNIYIDTARSENYIAEGNKNNFYPNRELYTESDQWIRHLSVPQPPPGFALNYRNSYRNDIVSATSHDTYQNDNNSMNEVNVRKDNFNNNNNYTNTSNKDEEDIDTWLTNMMKINNEINNDSHNNNNNNSNINININDRINDNDNNGNINNPNMNNYNTDPGGFYRNSRLDRNNNNNNAVLRKSSPRNMDPGPGLGIERGIRERGEEYGIYDSMYRSENKINISSNLRIDVNNINNNSHHSRAVYDSRNSGNEHINNINNRKLVGLLQQQQQQQDEDRQLQQLILQKQQQQQQQQQQQLQQQQQQNFYTQRTHQNTLQKHPVSPLARKHAMQATQQSLSLSQSQQGHLAPRYDFNLNPSQQNPTQQNPTQTKSALAPPPGFIPH